MDDQTANTTISTSLSTSPPNSMLKQPVKSILKNKSSPTVQRIEKEKKASAAILWDESNLKYNEEHKTATMKIDEPKTPYHYDDMSDKEDEDHQKIHPEDLAKAIENLGQDNDDEDEEEEENKPESKEFAKKRKTHYNEFQALQQWRKEKGLLTKEEEQELESKKQKKNPPSPPNDTKQEQ